MRNDADVANTHAEGARSRMSDRSYGFRGPGIDDWYLDRHGRGEFSADDDRPGQGPDTWVDRLSELGVVRGNAAPLGRPSRTAGARRNATQPTTSAARPARSRREKDGSDPGQLVRKVTQIQQQSSRTLSYVEVIEKLRAAGTRISKGELQRAFAATNTTWGKPSRKEQAKPRAETQDSGLSAKKPMPQSERITARLVHEVRLLRAARPGLGAAEITRRLQLNGRVIRETDVRAILRTAQAQQERGTPHTAR